MGIWLSAADDKVGYQRCFRAGTDRQTDDAAFVTIAQHAPKDGTVASCEASAIDGMTHHVQGADELGMEV